MSRLLDLTGQTFGRLTVVERAANDGGGRARWLCRCDCGTEKVASGDFLRRGRSVSCGCKRAERNAQIGALSPGRPGYRVERPGYNAAHDRIRAERGKVQYHGCVDCSAPAEEWSYDRTDPDEMQDAKGRAYSGKPEHYSPRCRPCHRAFDRQEVTA